MAPSTLPKKYHRYWRQPWRFRARHSRGFKTWLRRHQYLAPHFTLSDASGAPRNPLGTDVPSGLVKKAQRHAFRLEILRHRLGDHPMPILSWYRNPRHNASVGGVSNSQHLRAVATDFTNEFINSIGRARFDREANKIFSKGGFGHYPSGSAHTDSRGFRARW